VLFLRLAMSAISTVACYARAVYPTRNVDAGYAPPSSTCLLDTDEQ